MPCLLGLQPAAGGATGASASAGALDFLRNNPQVSFVEGCFGISTWAAAVLPTGTNVKVCLLTRGLEPLLFVLLLGLVAVPRSADDGAEQPWHAAGELSHPFGAAALWRGAHARDTCLATGIHLQVLLTRGMRALRHGGDSAPTFVLCAPVARSPCSRSWPRPTLSFCASSMPTRQSSCAFSTSRPPKRKSTPCGTRALVPRPSALLRHGFLLLRADCRALVLGDEACAVSPVHLQRPCSICGSSCGCSRRAGPCGP